MNTEADVNATDAVVRGDVVIGAGAMMVALDTELTPELIQEGVVRECIRTIQQFRKDWFEISDRIHRLSTTDADVLAALNAFSTKIGEEVRAKTDRC